MPCLDIPASKSLTVSSNYLNNNINNRYIYIGNECSVRYISYLYFDISSIPSNIKDLCATLVLFKKPILYNKNTNYPYENYQKDISRCTIYPLLDYFSKYTTYYNRPKYDCSLQKTFFINQKSVCEEIDITHIVSNWISGEIPNKGLMFKGKKEIRNLMKFFSIINKGNSEIPFIKIYYTCHCNCNSNPGISTTRQAKVSGIVAPMSIYEAVIKLTVTRIDTGHTDDYYVTDQYDNLASSTPLVIDKIYNIAVIPQANPKDIEDIAFYGSYKDNVTFLS